MKNPTALLLSFVGLFACALPAAAQSDMAPAGAERQTSLSKADQKFLLKAAQASLAEVETARFVTQHGMRTDIKEYAQRLIADHEAAYGELSMLAERKGFSLPTSIGKDQQGAYNKLISTPAEKVDQTFIKQDMDNHEESIDLHKKAAESADDNELRALANKHLASLQRHMHVSEGLEKSLK